MGKNMYLNDNEIYAVIHTAEEWLVQHEEDNPEMVDKRMKNGLGSVLKKLYQDTRREKTYKKY